MTTSKHRAAVLDGFNRPLRMTEVATPAPGPCEVRVRVRAIALNPFDRIVQTLGGLVTPWVAFPAVLGSDVAGEVVAVGDQCRRIQVGDRVLGLTLGADRAGNRAAEGAFQEQVILRETCCCRLPAEVTLTQAAVLPLALATAASGLFLRNQLGLDPNPASAHVGYPTAPKGSVVVWGGATSVGSVAIQLARAAGYRVLSTASPHNHALLVGLGAAAVEDYREPRAVARLLEAAAGTTIAGVLAIGVGSGRACLQLAAGRNPRPKVAMASMPCPLDSAPIGPQIGWRLATLPRLAGGMAIQALRAGILRVPTSAIWGTALVDDPLGAATFGTFAEAALRDGRLQLVPEPLIAGSRLEDIPEAMETLRRGVSARKVVVQLG